MNVKLVLMVALSLCVIVAHGKLIKNSGKSILNEANKASKWVKGAGESIKNEANKFGKWVEGADESFKKGINKAAMSVGGPSKTLPTPNLPSTGPYADQLRNMQSHGN